MEKRILGKSNLAIQALGFGSAAIGGYYTRQGRVASRGFVDDSETIKAIHAALSHDIQLFDVANIYGAGHAERIMGQALQDGKRQQAILHVKFGASFDEVTKRQIEYEGLIEPEWIRNSLIGSLRRLQTDYLDIFQFQIADYPLEGILDIIEILEQLVDEGKIRAYSIGTGDIERAKLFIEAPHCADIITNHNILMDCPEMLQMLEEHQVALLAGVPFYAGLLTGKYNKDSVFGEDDLRQQFNLADERFSNIFSKLEAIQEILQSAGRTTAQGALAWIWGHSPITIPIPGFKTAQQVEDCVQALSFGALSGQQMQEIANILG